MRRAPGPSVAGASKRSAIPQLRQRVKARPQLDRSDFAEAKRCRISAKRSNPPKGCQAPLEGLRVTCDFLVEAQRPREQCLRRPSTLVATPPAGILIPFVIPVRDRADRRLDQLPAVIVFKGALDCTGDVCAPAAGAGPTVELTDDLLRKSDVHSHGYPATGCSVTCAM
jgi:hypothetical protein